MATLSRELRKGLDNTVRRARRVGEDGAHKALAQLAVQHHEPWSSLTPEQRKLRNRLRAHGRQLGDTLEPRTDRQEISRLAHECAYEHWHRMLFARFLAENNLLIEPDSGVPITLGECRELALERGADWLVVASEFAVRMLPQIFRAGDPVLEVALPPETRQELEQLLKSLPGEVFLADDSLGWVYQFWQAERKQQVNDSGVKIGGDELPAVTQLFTEDYMVLFLLHNTLGAWWTAKRKEEGKDPNLPGYEWTYLRLKEDGTPAAGSFEGWPRAAKEIKVLDPCMGSGHFLVFALPILVGFRMEEEGLTREQAVEAVLLENLFGLEIDPRCTQIAAFDLALAAWRTVGYRRLPQLNLACSGLGIHAKEEEWLRFAGNDSRLRVAMQQLYAMFRQAPILGSLIDPKRVGGTLFVATFAQVRPVLDGALEAEQPNENASELAVTAKGVVEATRILADKFTLVTTNVPYLGRGKQTVPLTKYCEDHLPDAKADLATSFVDRCLALCSPGGSTALVTPQNWLFLTSYEKLRRRLLGCAEWALVVKLGPRAFETVTGEVVNVVLLVLNNVLAGGMHSFAGLDVGEEVEAAQKSLCLRNRVVVEIPQKAQLQNADARIILSVLDRVPLLKAVADASHGQGSFDAARFSATFWQIPSIRHGWIPQQSTPAITQHFGGCHFVFRWEDGKGGLAKMMRAKHEQGYSSGKWKAGISEWGKLGVLIGQMGELPCAVYLGHGFDENASVVIPHDPADLPAVWAFASSPEFRAALKCIDQSIKITCKTLVKVPFDLPYWKGIAAESYPNSLPSPESDDATQWLFNGHPKGSNYPLQVALARLLGYRWPRQTGSGFPNCPALGPDGLEGYADADGIVCLSPVKGESPAADRLRAVLAAAYRSEWSPDKQAELLVQVGYANKTLEDWLRNGFFEQHCELFHQRPFIWHLWDGLGNGFHALVNYHKLAGPNGEGRRTLEKLIYTYLGDWIDRQRRDQKEGVEGADARVAAAQHLRTELEKILEGEPPYDIFVRWKPLHEQSIGWEPDINDGVRLNIRPFMTARPLNGRSKGVCILRVTPKIKWEKDRGKEPDRARQDYPWFWGWDQRTVDFGGRGEKPDGNRWNDLHYSRAVKQAARQKRAVAAETGG